MFGQINQGAGVTAGLRKVTADMKAKNRAPSDRSGKVAAKTAPSAPAPAKAKGPAKLELQGNKWVVENQVRSLTQALRGAPSSGLIDFWSRPVRQLPSIAAPSGVGSATLPQTRRSRAAPSPCRRGWRRTAPQQPGW